MKVSPVLLSGVFCALLAGTVRGEVGSPLKAGMESGDAAVAEAAVAACVEKGVEFLPELRAWSRSDDPRLRLRARTAIGRLTGQWGSQTDLVWGRSFEAAKGKGKPILLLQLFGNLDEEFC